MKIPSLQTIFENISKSSEMLVICSWCNRINIEKEDWQEMEKAVVSLKLFNNTKHPQFSHGMCSDCYLSMSAKLSEMI